MNLACLEAILEEIEVTRNHSTLLTLACEQSEAQKVCLLLRYGADVNASEAEPLRVACRAGNTGAIASLLEKGADPYEKGRDPSDNGYDGFLNAFQIAGQKEDHAILETLSEYKRLVRDDPRMKDDNEKAVQQDPAVTT